MKITRTLGRPALVAAFALSGACDRIRPRVELPAEVAHAARPAPPAPRPDGDDAISLRVFRGEQLARDELAFIADARALLAVDLDGPGRVTLRVEQEGAPATTLTSEARSASSPAVFALPGTGARALRVHWRCDPPQNPTRVLLRSVHDAPARASPLVGALADRHLLVIVADALSAGHLGCLGSARPTSPRIDRLAREGVLFTQARAQSAWTLPSVATLMTGLPQELHGVRDVGRCLPASIPTLAEAMRSLGRRTEAFLQNSLLVNEIGLGRGFDAWREFGEADGDQFLDAVCAELHREPDWPLFAYIHLLPPHAPYTPPAPFATLFAAPAGRTDGSVEALARLNRPPVDADAPPVLRMAALYDNNVAFADSQVGALIDAAVAALGEEHLAVVFLSDHGEAFGQHGMLGHNAQLFDEMVHVPLILWAPGSALPAGTKVETPVSLTEVAASLRELCGDPGLPAEGSDARLAARISAAGTPGASDGLPLQFLSARYMRKGPLQRAVLFGSFKLVTPWGSGAALFDLAHDSGEQRDVAAAHPVLAAALGAELATWSARPEEEGSPFEPDEELEHDLESLGYAQGSGR